MTGDKFKTSGSSLYLQYFPAGKSECICRSGLRFKRCCKSGLEDRLANENASEANEATPPRRLRRARLESSHYWLRHTAHRAASGETLYAQVLDIDIRAMFELLENLMYITHEAGQLGTLLGTLDRLRGAVADGRWPPRISFLRALTHLYPNWSAEAEVRARAELKNVDADRLDDVELLRGCNLRR